MGRQPLDVGLGTWGCSASSRFAAPALRYGPSGDTLQPQAQWAFHGRKETSGRRGRLFEVNDDAVVKCHIYDQQIGAGFDRHLHLYAYSMASADALRESIGLYAGPEHLEVIGPERIRTRAVPGEWRRGQRLGFDLRVRPVRRAYSRIEAPDGRVYKKGAEMDAWLSDRLRSEHWKHESPKPAGSREEAYLDWLSERFSRVADLDRVATRLVRYRRAHARRRAVTTGPDATFQGTLAIKEPGGFTDFLRRGVGRHCGYGYGMLLLRPPDPGESWNARE